MRKLKVFIARLKSASFARMKMHILEIHKESKKPKICILFDMLWCVVRYGVGYLDYHVFGFAYIKGKRQRKTFMTMDDNLKLIARVNQEEYRHFFQNKVTFLTSFCEFTGREFLNLETACIEEFVDFVKRKGTVFAKPIDDFGGHGIQKICAAQVTDWTALHRSLLEAKSVLLEEEIVQHPQMNTLNASCINTIRMVTLLKNGEAHLMYSLIRVGSGTGVVDNISSGGMYAPVWEDGKIAKPAFCDATGLYYDKHPITGVSFVGFEVPCYEEAVALVKKASFMIPQVQYVGWDVAISEKGPVLVEGNDMPGYDMCQNYHHLRDDKKGILAKFQA